MRLHTCLLTAACAVGLLGTAANAANAATNQHLNPNASDAGPTASSDLITTSVILNVTDLEGLKQFVADTTTGGRDHHRFLSVEQFRDRFAPSDKAMRQLVCYLESYGITVGIDGMQLTQPGQSLWYYPTPGSTTGAQDLIDLPADFHGRNVPDLALNADPQTGYIVYDCTDFQTKKHPSCAEGGWGGTSFVAPQLNGITALIDQAAGGRVGLLNPAIYALQRGSAYGKWAISGIPNEGVVKM